MLNKKGLGSLKKNYWQQSQYRQLKETTEIYLE